MTILGVDVSHYQATTAAWWRAARAAGIQFGIAKASQGVSFTDPMYSRNVDWMQLNGILPGAYHFLIAGDGAAQADYFVSVIGQVGPLLCVLDVESTGDNMANVSQFATRFQATGRTLIIYTGSWYWVGRMGNPNGAPLGPLWHAAYPSSRGSGTPAGQWANVNSTSGFQPGYGGWSSAAIWQFSDNATLGGLTCDADAFAGSLDQLHALAGGPVEADMTPDEMTAWAGSSAGRKALGDAILAHPYYEVYVGTGTVPVLDALAAAAKPTDLAPVVAALAAANTAVLAKIAELSVKVDNASGTSSGPVDVTGTLNLTPGSTV